MDPYLLLVQEQANDDESRVVAQFLHHQHCTAQREVYATRSPAAIQSNTKQYTATMPSTACAPVCLHHGVEVLPRADGIIKHECFIQVVRFACA